MGFRELSLISPLLNTFFHLLMMCENFSTFYLGSRFLDLAIILLVTSPLG